MLVFPFITILVLGIGSTLGWVSFKNFNFSLYFQAFIIALIPNFIKNIPEEFVWRGYLTPKIYSLKGNWNGKQVISEEWVKESTKMDIGNREDYYGNLNPSVRYKYLWWGYSDNTVNYDFFAAGKYGQFIYVSPENKRIIVRSGIRVGKIDIFSWPAIFHEFVNGI